MCGSNFEMHWIHTLWYHSLCLSQQSGAMCNSNDVVETMMFTLLGWLMRLRQKPSEGKYTKTCIHMLLEYTAVFRSLKGVESLSEHIGWPNWQWRSDTDAIRKQKINEGGWCPWRVTYMYSSICAHNLQTNVHIVHTRVHKASRHFPYCSTFTIFPLVLFRLGFISTQNVTLLT